MFFSVRIRKSGENRYEASVPDLPGCRVESPTKARALTDVHLAIETLIAELLGKGRSVPESSPASNRESNPDSNDEGAEWFSVHINLAHLEAVAIHQAGRW
jgi:predicted RNase H-like HicB family nuclease